jgi:hypothetical protein
VRLAQVCSDDECKAPVRTRKVEGRVSAQHKIDGSTSIQIERASGAIRLKEWSIEEVPCEKIYTKRTITTISRSRRTPVQPRCNTRRKSTLSTESKHHYSLYLATRKAQNRDQQYPELTAANKTYEEACADIVVRRQESWRKYWDAQHEIDNPLTEAHDGYIAVWSREQQRT